MKEDAKGEAMMNTKSGKKILILMICLGAAIGLFGCTGDTKENSDKSTVIPTETSVATEAKEESGDDITIDKNALEGESDLQLSFSKNSGVYDSDFKLEITCDGEAKIFYTTDGSNPITSNSRSLYSTSIDVTDRSNDENYVSAVDPGLFDSANVVVNSTGNGFDSVLSVPSKNKVDKCTVIRAVACDTQGEYTDITSNTYFVGDMADHINGIKESCEAAGTKLAIISLSIDYEDLFDSEKGIYVKGDTFEQALTKFLNSGDRISPDTARQLDANYKQKGKEWERAVHMDYFESDGASTTCELQQNCGVRIQGNYSRSDLQKGLRLYARKKYGESDFEYAFFGEDLRNDIGETINKFKTITLRNGGNCAFSTKYSDTYWQSLIKDLDCDTQTSRPCVVYIDGEYWGLYVMQEDYSQEYFENTHGVNEDDVVLYKGDGEAYEIGYKLDLGELPEEETDVSYYFRDLLNFYNSHDDLTNDTDFEEFAKIVDVDSARDYFAVQVWINNKWDWPGKNWSMWKTANIDNSNPYSDGKWRFCFYDVEFGGVSGAQDAVTNTIKEDGYQQNGLLDRKTKNPAALVFVYLMTNEGFRNDFEASLKSLSEENFNRNEALIALDTFKNIYSPLYDQFFSRYGVGSKENAINGGYASYQCIKSFLELRGDNLQPMLDYVDAYYKTNQ